MRKVLFILFLCMFTLYGQKIDLINQTKSSCTAGWVFYGGTSGRVACDGNLTWDGTTLYAFKGYFYNATPTTGSSSIVIRQGAGQGGSAPFYIVNNANDQTMNGFTASGGIFASSQQGITYYNNPANGARWLTLLANAETGSNVGSDFYLARYSDAGAFLGYPFWLKRSTGVATFSQTIAGSITGNAGTSTALAADPAGCTNQFTRDINASGTATCASVAGTDFANQTANYGFMGPASGGAAAPTFRALVSADIPNNAANTSGLAGTASALAADPTDCAAGQFANAIAANGNLTCAVASAGYRASLTNSAVQSLNNDAATALTFDTEVEDVGGMHDSGTNPSRITIPAGGDGVYLLVCSVGYAAHATGFRQATMYLGGATVLTNNTYEAVSTAGKITVVQSSTYKSLVATNYVECYGQQNSGGALNTSNSAWNTFFQVVKLN